MNTQSQINLKDERTGKTYCVGVYDEKQRKYAMDKLVEKMDYDYFEGLPAEQRINKKKIPTDFTCPFCKEKTEVSSRKEKIVSWFLFFSSTRLIDIFKCHKCNREFTQDRLDAEIENVWRQNNVIINFENWKDAKRDGKNPPEFMSLDKVDEVIISSFTPIK